MTSRPGRGGGRGAIPKKSRHGFSRCAGRLFDLWLRGASIRQFAKQTRTSLALLLDDFGSKEELLKRMMENVLAGRASRSSSPDDADVSAGERLRP
jgi:hypothetical protein